MIEQEDKSDYPGKNRMYKAKPDISKISLNLQQASADTTFVESNNAVDLKELGVPNSFFSIKIKKLTYLGR